jgi:threonine dehydratase
MFSKQSRPAPVTEQWLPARRPEWKLAELSDGLMPLMRENGLAVEFLPGLSTGLWIADASRNPTNAYKVRGALASAQAAQLEGKRFLVTASAGNHGAGIAYAAQLRGMKARVYVPENAPQVKIQKIEGFGAEIKKAGSTFDECLAYARRDLDVQSAKGKFVHPFDDMIVAAGQGTIGIELLERAKTLALATETDVVRVFLPIGGGGLMAGVASAMKTRWSDDLPKLEIVGVIDESAPASLLATLFGRPVRVLPNTIADGTKVALVGETFLSVSPLVDRLILVPHDAIVSAMRRYEVQTLSRVEGAGALALAGEELARSHSLFADPKPPISFAVVTGRNVDATTYHDTVTATPRLNLDSHLRQGFDVRVEERQGELLHFLKTVQGYNIASLTYKQRPGTRAGHLLAEFEVETKAVAPLHDALMERFPGSRLQKPGEHMLYDVGRPVAQKYKEELITLDDKPGAFLRCVEELTQQGRFGSVGFLFYRKPPLEGAFAQVVIGRY